MASLPVFSRWKELGKGWTSCLNDVWHSTEVDFGCVSSRILWIKFKFVGWWVTAPMIEMVKKGIASGTTWIGLWIV